MPGAVLQPALPARDVRGTMSASGWLHRVRDRYPARPMAIPYSTSSSARRVVRNLLQQLMRDHPAMPLMRRTIPSFRARERRYEDPCAVMRRGARDMGYHAIVTARSMPIRGAPQGFRSSATLNRHRHSHGIGPALFSAGVERVRRGRIPCRALQDRFGPETGLGRSSDVRRVICECPQPARREMIAGQSTPCRLRCPFDDRRSLCGWGRSGRSHVFRFQPPGGVFFGRLAAASISEDTSTQGAAGPRKTAESSNMSFSRTECSMFSLNHPAAGTRRERRNRALRHVLSSGRAIVGSSQKTFFARFAIASLGHRARYWKISTAGFT